ncbi:TetR family transcriptional regulator [Reticulibacter mediterranei]|uniref:TetR family transcriptional regulator n=1 Tax=Reticulibacter mediterranei TaxID=2778369 RepID=A0A8J3N852_9CHLR|nr:TetR/AcrR family transcriptional regulator [Reticulibacter mediterranei]GHO97892.1 TetR family transcriptional regulator [Reticulibacter mediterranei]
MARQKEFVPEQALDKAMNLFWKQGYEGSSVEDLVQCTGLGRGSLYDTFGDKHALYLAAYDRYCIVSSGTLDALRHSSGTLQETLRDFFQARVEEAVNDPERRGCFMVNAALEMAPHDPEVAQRVQEGLAETEEAFYHALIKAQARGELAWTCDPHQFARFLVNMLVGMRVLARTNPDRRTLEQIVETALLLFR